MKCSWKLLPVENWMRSSLRLFQTTLCVPLLLGLATRAHAADTAHPPRVLVVNSFGSRAPPFTTHSTAFETTLTREMGTQVDLDEVSLDHRLQRSLPAAERPRALHLRQRPLLRANAGSGFKVAAALLRPARPAPS